MLRGPALNGSLGDAGRLRCGGGVAAATSQAGRAGSGGGVSLPGRSGDGGVPLPDCSLGGSAASIEALLASRPLASRPLVSRPRAELSDPRRADTGVGASPLRGCSPARSLTRLGRVLRPYDGLTREKN